jgi:catechol 2,3-dioxygenase-like lactoylglutathione lyase family enzyme
VSSLNVSEHAPGNLPARRTYLSHYGLRTRRLEVMIDWYKTVLGAEILHRNASLAFLTFDEEHHRLVIFEDPDTVSRAPAASGVDHIGYGLPSLGDFVDAFERLKAHGIVPFLPMNHVFTTSLYYHDPDGNEVEFTVDNFPTKAECEAFVRSDMMAEIGRPPFGYPFDADEFAKCYRAGASRHVLARIGIPKEGRARQLP